MNKVKDINIYKTDNGFYDIDFSGGDFKIAESDQNHILLIVYSYKNAFKEFPLVGFGIWFYLASPTQLEDFKRDLTVQLVSDGFTVNSITVLPNSNEYYVDAIRNI